MATDQLQNKEDFEFEISGDPILRRICAYREKTPEIWHLELHHRSLYFTTQEAALNYVQSFITWASKDTNYNHLYHENSIPMIMEQLSTKGEFINGIRLILLQSIKHNPIFSPQQWWDEMMMFTPD